MKLGRNEHNLLTWDNGIGVGKLKVLNGLQGGVHIDTLLTKF